MWVSDRHPDRARLLAHASGVEAPPEPAGETLFTSERNQGAEQLRVSLEEYQGHDFVRAQVWTRNAAGDFWPAKGRCVTFKLRELPALAEALSRVATGQNEAVQAPTPRPEPPRPPGTRPAPKRHRQEALLPLQPDDPRRRWQPPPATSPVSAESSAPFDEFEDHTS